MLGNWNTYLANLMREARLKAEALADEKIRRAAAEANLRFGQAPHRFDENGHCTGCHEEGSE